MYMGTEGFTNKDIQAMQNLKETLEKEREADLREF